MFLQTDFVCLFYSYRYSIVLKLYLFPSLPLSLTPFSTALSVFLALFQRVQKSLHILEVINLVCRSVSPAAMRSEGCLSVVPSLSHFPSHAHTLSLFNLPVSVLYAPFLNVCRRGGWCRISGCSCVRSEASSPTAEPHARGADQPSGAPYSFCKYLFLFFSIKYSVTI